MKKLHEMQSDWVTKVPEGREIAEAETYYMWGGSGTKAWTKEVKWIIKLSQ